MFLSTVSELCRLNSGQIDVISMELARIADASPGGLARHLVRGGFAGYVYTLDYIWALYIWTIYDYGFT